MDERREFIMNGLKIKHDCFAYHKETHQCKALKELDCKYGKCKFYKTAFERCEECKASRTQITCEDCKKHGLK